ncbi:glycoside hydrolase family 73 protein [Mucilaginibacter aquatilis]|nr:glucosaminidase domain-containing protein [Mucilaginibacter aquatilis]
MSTIIEFIKKINHEVKKSCANTRLFPSVMIAQAILESNAGKSKLAMLHNNYFGIKSTKMWAGNSVHYLTTEYQNGIAIKIKQPFRSYPSMKDGFADRVKFLQVNKRYTVHGVFTSISPEEQVLAFLKAGYATDPNYAIKLVALIRKYDLKQFDL